MLGRTATATPKTKSGLVEVIRTLRVTRASAVESRTQAFNALFGVMIGAPSPLRDELVGLTKRTLVNRCLRLRPQTDDLLEVADQPQRLLLAGVKTALRDLARRWKALDAEIKALNRQIELLVTRAAPELVALFGVGVELAGQFLMTAGDNAERIRNEAAFAKLCGVAPQPASSGRTTGRHRLSGSLQLPGVGIEPGEVLLSGYGDSCSRVADGRLASCGWPCSARCLRNPGAPNSGWAGSSSGRCSRC